VIGFYSSIILERGGDALRVVLHAGIKGGVGTRWIEGDAMVVAW